MKTTILFLLLTISSVGHSSKLSKQDTSSLQALLGKAQLIIYDNPDSAINIAQIASAQARQLGLTKEEGQANRLIGDYYQFIGKNDSALFFYQQSIKLSQKIGSKRSEAIDLMRVANIYSLQKKYKENYQDLQKALAIAQFIKDDELIAAIYINLGNLYKDIKNYDKALEYLQLALKGIHIDEQVNLSMLKYKAICLSDIGLVFEVKGLFELADEYYKEAHVIYDFLGDKYNLAWSYRNLGYGALNLNDTDLAIKHLEKALLLVQTGGFKMLEPETLNLLAEAYLKANSPLEASERALASVYLSKNLHDPDALSEAYFQLSLAYTQLKQPEQSTHYMSLYKQLSDSLIATERNFEVIDPLESLSKDRSEVQPTLIMILALLGVIGSTLILRTQIKKRGKKAPKRKQKQNNIANTKPLEDLLLSSPTGESQIKVDQIRWIEKGNKKCHVTSFLGEYETSKTIGELEKALSPSLFHRINRATIINIECFDNYSFWEHDKYIVRMKGVEKKEFYMSRDRLKNLNDLLGLKKSNES